jgi:ribosomal protein S13
MKKEIDINKLSEILRSLDSDVGSDYSYHSEHIGNVGFDEDYLLNKFKEEEKLTVEEIIEGFVIVSNKLISKEKERLNKLTEENENLKEYKDYISKKGLDSDFSDYIKEKELLEKEEFEKLEIPF